MQTDATAYPVNIGQAAAASGVSAKMIRHYEEIGLVPAPVRTPAGYRVYAQADVHRLRFVRRARALGFTMEEIRELLALWGNQRRSSARVKALTERHIAALGARIAELEAMQHALADLARRCHGDERPDCPILDELAGS